MVYRREGTSSTYRVVENKFSLVSHTYRDDGRSFVCTELQLAEDDQFEIQQNDVIAACLDTQRPLRITGQLSSTGSQVYLADDSDYDQCDDGEIDVIDSGSNTFNFLGDVELYLSAQIGMLEVSYP